MLADIAAVRFALDVTLKVTILLAAAGIARLLLRRMSAAGRHALTTLALAGAALLPLLAPLVPRLRVPLLAYPFPKPGIERPAPAVAREEVAKGKPEDFRGASSFAASRTVRRSEPAVSGGAAIPSRSFEQPIASPRRPMTWPQTAFVVWALGAAYALARLATGTMRVRHIARHARPVFDLDWILAKDELSQRLGLTGPVRLLKSDGVAVAMTYGAAPPLLLLAADADRWTPERRRLVLLHELAHVKRRDWISLLLAEVVRAIYWFHPLVWGAVGLARKDCEKACDDLVLAFGTKPSVYAAHLLGIVRSLPRRPRLLPAVPMARPSQFESRMRAILDGRRPRRGLSAVEASLIGAGMFVAVIATGAVQPWFDCGEQRTTFLRRAAFRLPGLRSLLPISMSDLAAPFRPKAPKKPCEHKKGASPAIDRNRKPLAGSRTAVRGRVEEGVPGGVAGGVVDGVLGGISGGAAAGVKGGSARGVEGGVAGGVGGGVSGGIEGFENASQSETKKPERTIVVGGGRGWYARGMELHNEGRYEEAIEAFQRAIAAGHREAASSYNIACGYAREGKTNEALEWLARAREAGFDVAGHLDQDDDLDNLRGITAFETMRGSRETKTSRRRSEAADAAREYATLAGDSNASGEELYRVAKKLYSAKSYDLAARAYHQSADAGYRVGTSRYNEACSRALAGDRAPALDLLERSVLAGFDDPSLMRKDSDLASLRSERRFGEILQLAEDLSLPGFSFGAAKLTFCPWQKRAEQYAAFAQRHPEIGRAWFNLGFAKIQTHEQKEAAAALERALALNYRKPTTMYNLACSLALAGQRDRAFEWLFRALDEGFEGNGMLKHDSDLSSLHGDPRFREAVERAERDSAHSKKG